MSNHTNRQKKRIVLATRRTLNLICQCPRLVPVAANLITYSNIDHKSYTGRISLHLRKQTTVANHFGYNTTFYFFMISIWNYESTFLPTPFLPDRKICPIVENRFRTHVLISFYCFN